MSAADTAQTAEQYFEAARSWELSQMDEALRRARLAWRVAAMACLCLLATLACLAMLLPLKQVVPFMVRVDNRTGIVDVVPRYEGSTEVSELVTRHLLSQFVSTRERYVESLAEADYAQVGAYQSAPLNQAWYAAWARTNPDSPLNRYRDGTSLRTQVTAVTFLGALRPGQPRVAQVRFVTFARQGANSGAGESAAHYIATLAFAFGPPSRDDAQRALNPLGLKVLEYRREPELVSAEPAAPLSASAGGAQ